MQNNNNLLSLNSAGWVFFVKICFVLSLGAMGVAIVFLPTNIWVKGYLGMGSLLTVSSSFMLAKTLRDEFEAGKLANRITEARTEKMLKEIENI